MTSPAETHASLHPETVLGPSASVTRTLLAMRGTWHDRLDAFRPDGTPMDVDDVGNVLGAYPYDNIVYVDFDGVLYTQTNVTFRGRAPHVRTFTASVREGVLVFDRLGPEAPEHIGVSLGEGRVAFLGRDLGAPGLQRYSEPDFVEVNDATRLRLTTLYRDGACVRTLRASGTRLSPDASHRVAFDPRGADGPVHDDRSSTQAFTGGHDD